MSGELLLLSVVANAIGYASETWEPGDVEIVDRGRVDIPNAMVDKYLVVAAHVIEVLSALFAEVGEDTL